jgi:hypothetical protein
MNVRHDFCFARGAALPLCMERSSALTAAHLVENGLHPRREGAAEAYSVPRALPIVSR